MNPGILLVLGGLAVFAFAGRGGAKKEAPGAEKDVTGTIPKKTGHEPPPTQDQVNVEQIAIEEMLAAASMGRVPMMVGPLGQQAVDEGVLGIDDDTIAYPIPGEYLTGWLTRAAYWMTYPMYHEGWPYQLPVSCILGDTCPAEYQAARAALIRIHEAIREGFAARKFEDPRYNAEADAFV